MLDLLAALAWLALQLGLVASAFALFSLLVHRIRESHARAAYYRDLREGRVEQPWPEVKL